MAEAGSGKEPVLGNVSLYVMEDVGFEARG